MLIEINKLEIDNKDVRMAVRTLRNHNMYVFRDGYYYAYVTKRQIESLFNDPKIMNLEHPKYRTESQDPAIYECRFFVLDKEDLPARFFGSHIRCDELIQLAEVN